MLDSTFYLKLTARTLASVNCHYSSSYFQVLFELNDNDTIVISTIIKKLQDMSRNTSRKYCKVTFTFASQKYQKWRHFFHFEELKNIPQVNYGKQPSARSNVGACSKNILDNIR